MSHTIFPGRTEIETMQANQLGFLLQQARRSPFHHRRLEECKLVEGSETIAHFKARCPFVTKRELAENQAQFPPYGTIPTQPLNTFTRLHQTSGTSGAPLRWLDTGDDWNALLDCWREVYRAAGVGMGSRIFFAFSFGPFLGFWTAFEAATSLGCLSIPGGGLSTAARLKLMAEAQTNVLCCTPTYAMRLGEAAREEHSTLPPVRLIIVAGEPGGSLPAVRSRLQELWPGARVFDHHGMTEVGPVTYECPSRPGVLHVIESHYLAEIVETASGNPVTSGVAGELILTPLRRLGMPLLRYRTGDLVEAAPADRCICGRSELSLVGGILGRVDDMVVVRGVNVYPSAIEEIVRRCGITEYGVKIYPVNSMMELEIEIEGLEDASDKLGAMIEESLGLRVLVRSVPHGSLPRTEMKSHRWKRPTK